MENLGLSPFFAEKNCFWGMENIGNKKQIVFIAF